MGKSGGHVLPPPAPPPAAEPLLRPPPVEPSPRLVELEEKIKTMETAALEKEKKRFRRAGKTQPRVLFQEDEEPIVKKPALLGI